MTDESIGNCPTCGADPEYIKERENEPAGIYGSHVCTMCGCELGGKNV